MKKILVIGAGFLQSFVIQKAKEIGYYVLAVDGNPGADGFPFADEYKVINIIDEEACLEYAKEKNVDGVLTAATDYGVLTAAYIAQEMSLHGLNYKSAQLIKNKYFVRKRFYEKHVDDTKQAYEVTKDTDLSKLVGKIEFPVMVKPCDGSGSRGANKVCVASELEHACNSAINNSIIHKAEIETFIIGHEYGVESFVENGNIHVLAVMKKWMTNPPYYAELGHAIPSGLSMDVENKIKECVINAIHALEINFGAVNMDVLVTENGKVHIVDVGARMGGNLIGSHIIKIGTGIDYLANLIKATVGDPINLSPFSVKKKVATCLLALTPGVVLKLPDMKKIENYYDVKIYHHLHEGDIIKEYHTNLDGCGYIVSTSDDEERAVKNAKNAREAIDHGIVRG